MLLDFYIYLDDPSHCYLDLLMARFMQQKQIELAARVIIPNRRTARIWRRNVQAFQGKC